MRMLFITDANGDYMVQSRYNERVCVTKLISSFTALLLYLFFSFFCWLRKPRSPDEKGLYNMFYITHVGLLYGWRHNIYGDPTHFFRAEA